MEIVLDSNILFRTLITGGDILKIFFNPNLTIFAPNKLKKEFIKNRQEILEKSQLPEEEFNEFSKIIFNLIIWISKEEYQEYIHKAKQLLGKHEKYEDFIALCLYKNVKLWTYESLLFRIGFGISTKEISNNLKQL